MYTSAPDESGRHAHDPVPSAAWVLLAFLTALNVLNFVVRQLIPSLAPLLIDDLGLTRAQIGAIIGFAFVVVYSVVGMLLGLVADRYSRKALIAGGLTVWSVATAASGVARSYVALAVPRVFSGMGQAVLTPAALAMLGDVFPLRRLGLASGIYYAGLPIGTGLSLFLAGWLAPRFGWRVCFYVVGAAGLVALGLLAFVREPARRRKPLAPADRDDEQRGDASLLGSAVPSASVHTGSVRGASASDASLLDSAEPGASVRSGSVRGASSSDASPRKAASQRVSLPSAASPRAAWRDRPSAAAPPPVVPSIGGLVRDVWRALREQPALVLLMIGGAALTYGAAAATHGVTWLVQERGYTFQAAASMSGVMAVASGFFGNLGGGWLSDWCGRRWRGGRSWSLVLMTLVFAPFGVGFFLLPPAGPLFHVCWFFSAASTVAFFGPLFSAVQELSPVRARSSLLAFTLLAINLLGVGPGSLITGVVGDHVSLTLGLLVSVGVGLAGTVAFTLAAPKRPRS